MPAYLVLQQKHSITPFRVSNTWDLPCCLAKCEKYHLDYEVIHQLAFMRSLIMDIVVLDSCIIYAKSVPIWLVLRH